MRFEEKKFCQVSTLADRWDCSTRQIYRLIDRGILRPFHPEGLIGSRGLRVDVASVLDVETRGILDIDKKFE